MNNLLERILDIADAKKDEIACVYEQEQLTYNELISRAKRLAGRIGKNNPSGNPVGICLKRSEKVIVSMLAILFAGCAYVPIDSRIGRDRIANMLEQVSCDLVLVDGDIELGEVRTVDLNDYENETELLPVETGNNDIAYVIFTSGSTGNPKGVKITYGNIHNLVKSLERTVYKGSDTHMNIAVLASFSFDSSVKQIYFALTHGHTLHIISEKTKKIKRYFFKYISAKKVDVCDITPTLIEIFSLDNRDYGNVGLKKLLIGGEKVTGNHINKARELFGGQLTIYNVYGPTECCVDAAIYEIPNRYVYSDSDSIPVGYPINNTMIRLSKTNEVIISGACVGAGYTGRSQGGYFWDGGIRSYATGDIGFFDEESRLFISGRSDDQVKLNGYRIELKDVENTAMKMNGVVKAKCFISEKQIICVLVTDNRDVHTYRESIQKMLPDYMVPKVFLFDETIRVNRNQKFDVKYYKELLCREESGQKPIK